MKQPIITRDLERKAIYTNIIYDPEWTYVEVNVEDYKPHTLNIASPVVVDWGDGTINKETEHIYEGHSRRVIIRIKGDLKGSQLYDLGITKILQIGKYVTSCSGMFVGCVISDVDPNIFRYATQVTDCSDMFR